MKPRQSALWFAVALLASAASAQPSAPAEQGRAADTHAMSPTIAPSLQTEVERLSYALGVNAASQLQKHSLQINPDIYSQGLRDGLGRTNLLMTPEQASLTVAAQQTKLAAQQRSTKTGGLKHAAEKNKAEGEAFLAENKTKEGVITLESGLQYKVLVPGEGRRPTLEDTVVCNFRGTLINGTEFDSTAKRGKPATIPVEKVIKGWREALQLMPLGAKWQIVVPPHLAYGRRGTGKTIGPGATLLFELELVAIKEKPAPDEPQVATAATAAPANKPRK